MNKATKDFLTKIGVSASTIETISAEELPEGADLDQLAGGFRDNLKALAKNDPDLIKGIRDEIRGTELSKIEHKIKKTFDLSADDMKEKKFEEILDVALDKVRKEAGSTSEELQGRIQELSGKVKDYEENILPGVKAEANQKIVSFRRDLTLQGVLSKKNLIVGNEVVLPALNAKLNEFNIGFDEQGQIEVKTKDGLKPLSSDGTKALTFEDIIDQQLDAMNVVKKSNGSPGSDGAGGTKKPGEEGGGNSVGGEETKYSLPGMKRAQTNADNLKEMKTFGGGES